MEKIELNKEAKLDALEDIKQFYSSEMEETVSDFQAEILLDFITSKIGPYIYNQAIEDSYQLMSQKIEDLYGLEKRRFRE